MIPHTVDNFVHFPANASRWLCQSLCISHMHPLRTVSKYVLQPSPPIILCQIVKTFYNNNWKKKNKTFSFFKWGIEFFFCNFLGFVECLKNNQFHAATCSSRTINCIHTPATNTRLLTHTPHAVHRLCGNT
jgi:uncharacterized membrane protein YesL